MASIEEKELRDLMKRHDEYKELYQKEKSRADALEDQVKRQALSLMRCVETLRIVANPIKNIGIRTIRKTANECLNWMNS